MKRLQSRGMTLIEVLIVIAIIGLLFQLMLPAIQMARESARQTECKNNLHQLALGAQLHANTQGHFPTGGWNSSWVGDPDRGYSKKQPGGWGYNVLAYIERADLHDLGSGLPEPERQKAAAQIYGTVVPTFVCPSRRLPRTFQFIQTRIIKNADMKELKWLNKTARSDYAANMGTILPPADFSLGPSSLEEGDKWKDGTDPKSSWVATDNNGVIFQRSEVKLAMVTDGLSKTILLGEKMVPDYSKPPKTTWTHCDDQSLHIGFSYDNNRAGHAMTPPAPDNMFPTIKKVRQGQEVPTTLWRFGSVHPTGFYVANCDGSVHRIDYAIDMKVFSAMCTRNGSEVTSSED